MLEPDKSNAMASKRPAAIVNPSYAPVAAPPGGFRSFQSFYPFYLGEHSLATTRRLHLLGTTIALACTARASINLLHLLAAHIVRLAGVDKSPNVVRLLSRLAALRVDRPGRWILSGILSAYALAWVGHFFVEKNRPATFKYPLWSLRGDLRMWLEVISLQRAF